jgi:hypothetical protein
LPKLKSSSTSFGRRVGVEAEVEYSALVSVKVNLGTGEVASDDIRVPGDGDEVPAEVGVSLDSETDQHDEVFDLAQYLVDAAAPFELRGWWLPPNPTNDGHQSSTARMTPVTTRWTRG